MKDLWAQVIALMQSDEAQNGRIQQLEEEVAALKSQSVAAGGSEGGIQPIGPGGSSTPTAEVDADTATSTTPAEPLTASNDNEPAVDGLSAPAEPELNPEWRHPTTTRRQKTSPQRTRSNGSTYRSLRS